MYIEIGPASIFVPMAEIGKPVSGNYHTHTRLCKHAEGEPAVSLHCYSPALWRMGHYEPDPNGIVRRVAMTYADELLGAA